MASRPNSPEEIQAAVDAVRECNGNKRAAARLLGIPHSTLYSRLRVSEVRPKGQEISFDAVSGTLEIKGLTERLNGHRDALKLAGLDRAWRVRKWSTGEYDVHVKIKSKDGDRIERRTNYRIRADLERIIPDHYESALTSLTESLPAPTKWPKPSKQITKSDRVSMLEIGLTDVHFGKLAWGKETGGRKYDLEIAGNVYDSAVEQFIRDALALSAIETIYFPFGSDFLHIDTPANTTTGGTPQDTDGRMPKIIETAWASVIKAIERARKVAPVHVAYVPGNHDQFTAWLLCFALAQRFAHCDDVTVDTEPTTRKAVRYGCNFLGWAHGDKENPKDLASVFAEEYPDLWHGATTRELHTGHLHKVEETRSRARIVQRMADTGHGWIQRRLGSIACADRWHYQQGYIGGQESAQAFLYDKERGWRATLNYNASQ